jgi:uncharacterized protein with von Willebrand factor type A (vWA) domain
MIENALTIEILQGIRDDLQRSSRESAERFEAARREQEVARREQRAARAESKKRFEAIEKALRDVAEQLVAISRGGKA